MGPRAGSEIPLLEQAMGLLGLLIVAATLGFMVYRGLTLDGTLPDLEVRVTEIRPQEQGYVVGLRVHNRGGTTAAGVKLTGRLQAPDGAQTSEATLDYVPARSSRRAGLFFQQDPARYPLHVQAEGYQEP